MPRFRAEIRADFQQVYGVDLHTLWRRREGQRIIDLLDGLPRNSRFRAAMLNDPGFAKMIVDQEDKRRLDGEDEQPFEWDPAEYSPEVIALQRVESKLDEVLVYQDRQLYQKKSKRKPQDPVKVRTAVEVERERRKVEMGNSIIERFTPWAA